LLSRLCSVPGATCRNRRQSFGGRPGERNPMPVGAGLDSHSLSSPATARQSHPSPSIPGRARRWPGRSAT
jgi:hypothetical protein